MALLFGALLPAGAQTERPPSGISGTVEGRGFVRVNIAVPAQAGPSTNSASSAELTRTVRDDLEFSGFFDVVHHDLYRLIPPSPPGGVPHEDWLSIGADTVLLSKVSVVEGRVDLQAWLYDNKAEALLLAKRYGGSVELLRRVAHQLADDVVQQYTGRPGIALTRIAFVSRHQDATEIYIMDYDGQRIRRLTTTGTLNLSPVWSPDGNRLAFVSWRERRPDVYIMDSTGKLERIPAVVGELNAAPDWAPDGRTIVYSSDVDGNSELYVVDLRTGRNTRLTRSPSIETAPAHSPNGREIAFTSDRSGTPQIYVMDAEGLNPRRVSFEGGYNDSAAWSPRGDKLAYASRVDGRFHIVVLELATGKLTQLTRGPSNNENPRWAPDGRHIVFSSNRTGTYDIYTMAADGSGVRRLTRGSGSLTPDWSK